MLWVMVTVHMHGVLFFSFLETLKPLKQVLLSPALMDTSPSLCIGIQESFVLGERLDSSPFTPCLQFVLEHPFVWPR